MRTGILAQCVDLGLGIVQLPCPEEQAWGGVLKRHLLRAYGSRTLGGSVGRKSSSIRNFLSVDVCWRRRYVFARGPFFVAARTPACA